MSEIKIYSFHYKKDLTDKQRKNFLSVLNLLERQKVANFKMPLDADISLISRFLLRNILGSLLGKKPEEIEFLYTEYNRPYLETLDFNLSHSGRRIVIAINLDGRVGIDIEKIRPVELGLADVCFTEEEKKHVIKNSEVDLDNFFQFWTLKESFIKADGMGMSYPLLDFYFDIKKKIKINFKNNKFESNWNFEIFPFDPEYKMALCCDNENAIKIFKPIENLDGNLNE